MGRKKNLQDLDEFERGYIEGKMNNRVKVTANEEVVQLKRHNFKVDIKCKNKKQKDFLNILKDESKTICFGIGAAGSGKSYISLAYALQALKDESTPYKKIICLVPTCEAGAMSIGFLKGDYEQKILPYISADQHTMEKVLVNSGNYNAKQIIESLELNKIVDYQLVNFARGKTFDNSLILINESENYSKEEMLLLLTRIGENSKVIISGDKEQLDRKDIKKNGSMCGMEYALEKLIDMDEVACVEFDTEDIVRNPIISKIIDRWKK